jgi:hypothetical protein
LDKWNTFLTLRPAVAAVAAASAASSATTKAPPNGDKEDNAAAAAAAAATATGKVAGDNVGAASSAEGAKQASEGKKEQPSGARNGSPASKSAIAEAAAKAQALEDEVLEYQQQQLRGINQHTQDKIDVSYSTHAEKHQHVPLVFHFLAHFTFFTDYDRFCRTLRCCWSTFQRQLET